MEEQHTVYSRLSLIYECATMCVCVCVCVCILCVCLPSPTPCPIHIYTSVRITLHTYICMHSCILRLSALIYSMRVHTLHM